MNTARIHPNVILDGRLAIFHERSRWLALTDLHYGYEVEFRHAGRMFPHFGMGKIEERLHSLIADYSPRTVILAGDIAHGHASAREAAAFCRRTSEKAPHLILVSGNHDRGAISRMLGFQANVRADGFLIHHGHQSFETAPHEIEITGHHHPAVSLQDGAGLKMKLPAFIQEKRPDGERWILPAFSPWAGGTNWKRSQQTRHWACSPKRVFELV